MASETFLDRLDYAPRHWNAQMFQPSWRRACLRAWSYRRCVLWEVDWVRLIGNRLHLLNYGKMLEGRLAVDHLVQDAAEGPDIALATDFEAPHAFRQFNRFRTHVINGADLSLRSD